MQRNLCLPELVRICDCFPPLDACALVLDDLLNYMVYFKQELSWKIHLVLFMLDDHSSIF